jgi:hypothetical protein
VKECYYYLDSTPTHSYMKALYKYPQRAFPYEQLYERTAGVDAMIRVRDHRHGVFDEGRYFDIAIEYAKALGQRHPDPNRGRQPRTGEGAHPRAADALVSQHMVVGPNG